MHRSEFLRMSAILGIGMPFLGSCGSSKSSPILKPNEKVLIIGAGAAGLSAAYLLKRKGVDVTVLEASSTYGGRIESFKGFTDFTIPLGAEWLNTTEPVLERIVADPTVKIDVQTTSYDFEVDYCLDAENGEMMKCGNMGLSESDLRFTNSSWIDFYETYLST